MAYETGAATSVTDLLDKLRLFCIAAGWTVNRWDDPAITRRLNMQKNGLFANLCAHQGTTALNDNLNGFTNQSSTTYFALAVSMSDGYDPDATGAFNQPGAPKYNGYPRGALLSQLTAAIPAYHFFSYSDSDDILVVVEYRTGRFQMFGFGSLAKFNVTAPGGAWFGGGSPSPNWAYYEQSGYGPDSSNQNELIPFRMAYQRGSDSTSFLRCNVDSNNGWAASRYIADGSTMGPLAAIGQAFYDEELRRYTPSALGWQTSLMRQTVYVGRGNQFASPYGEIKHMRRLEITNYVPGDEFTLGSDTWKVFPYHQKGGPTEQRGYALLKET
ncbi:structural protein [Xanthomonas phage Bosa]|uniref:Phage protein n=1 Tax=Xanthomonas phage Bosa TaxID=2674976 RepID=A0A679KLK5_9CAUD|nr:structural protein [Xanthomonas phage Bosa]CAA2409845.1 Phage protein [Xanthomonas phage Bosa]